MIIRIKKGIIYAITDDFEEAIGSMFDTSKYEHEQAINAGSEAYNGIKQFVGEVNNGSMKLRSAVKEFESIISKYEQ